MAGRQLLYLVGLMLALFIYSSVAAEAEVLDLPSFKAVRQSAIDEADSLIKAVHDEVGKSNKFLSENPRRNSYSKVPNQKVENVARVKQLHSPAMVNTTVAAAAALLAEKHAASGGFGLNIMTRDVEGRDTSFWMETMQHSGSMPFGGNKTYKVFRNVKDFGVKGDGKTDDTAAINRAISEGNRCAENCNSTSVKAALIYFPGGTYLVSGTIVALYNSQLIGNPNNRPTILAAPSFVGLGVVSTDPYYNDRSNPDGSGVNWYINQSNFLRQIRNFIIDIRATTVQYPAGLHYQVAQATSLQNIDFYQSTDSKTTQQGIFSENGSGGFMSDLVFHGGNFGLYGGNQQFTVRNLKFINCNTAVQIIWDWAWTWKSLDISGGNVGISLLGENGKRETGSIFVTDSKFTNVPVAILTSSVIAGTGKGNTLITLDNVVFSGTPIAVQDNAKKTILVGGTQTIGSWTLGNYYDSAHPSGTFGPAAVNRPTIPSLLGGPNGGYFEKSRPQYENIPASGFLNIKTAGAKGDGVTDDTAAINTALASEAGKRIVYFPAGSYIVTDTIKIPPGTKIVGECWSQIMGKGQLFANMNAPYVMVRVGERGDTGDIEISDMLFTATGATAGIILMEWNILASSPGSAGLWDSHFRIGGAAGSGLQVKDCPIKSGSVKPGCIAGSMLLHVTSQSSMYAENMWAWVADHDLDDAANTQVDIYVARGILIESQGPSWFYGTASEHCVLYQYELYAAQNIYMAMIQTETPYFQPSPQAPAPFASTLGQFSGDFDFRDCPQGNDTAGCATSWGLRVVSCTNVVVGGAGLYSWFQNYDQACLATQNCQNGIVSTVINNGFWFYNLITIGAVQMISPTQSPIKRRGIEEPKEYAYLDAAPSKVPLIKVRATTSAPSLPTPILSSTVRPTITSKQTIPISSSVRTVSTPLSVAVPQTACAPGSVPSTRPNLAVILASANNFGQGKPQVAIIIAWLLESLVVRCYIERGPVRDTFACMGDSYGAGIGAGKPFQTDPVDKCKRGEFALGPQIFKEQDIWWNSNQSHSLDYVACSGARAYDMFKDGAGLHGHLGQDKEFTYVQDDIATLWLGGNDIGFFEIMDGCVYQFSTFLAPSCKDAIQKANDFIKATGPTSVQANITRVYEEIMRGANPRSGNFTLYVLGYAQFWNATTDVCNNSQMAFWTRWAGPKLIKANREAMNDVLLNLNSMLKSLVTKVSANLKTGRRIVFIDVDPLFEGHRFCDHGSEPKPINAKNYFFQIDDHDTLANGTDYDNVPFWPDKPSTLGVPSYPGANNATTCRSLLSGPARNNMLYGELAFCEISIMLADNPDASLNDTLYMQSGGGGQIGKQYDIMKYNRVFHPKTIGYAKVKDKIMGMIKADRAAGLL